MATPTSLLTARQQAFSDQYKSLEKVVANAQASVQNFQRIGNLNPSNPSGNFTSTQQTAYDQAKQQHLDAHAGLTAFLRDTATNLRVIGVRFQFFR